MNELQPVALREQEADVVVRGGTVLHTRTGEFVDADVVITGGRIAALMDDASDVIGDRTRTIDASGGIVAPGFIDAHAHMDHHITVEQAFPAILRCGTTTLVNELIFLGAALGATGVQSHLDATNDLPLDVRVAVPAHELFDVFEPPHADEQRAQALIELVDHDRSVGVGETVWTYVVGVDSPAEVMFERAAETGGVVVGHGAGCRGDDYAAFASVVDNDHEPITEDQVYERLENDVHVVGRYGSTRDDIDAIAAAYERVGPSGMSLSTDGVRPDRLLSDGYMDATVRRAIDAGIDAADAIRMATVNTAEHFNLSQKGTLAPGNDADLIVLDDLEAVDITTVISGGDIVVTNGTPLVEPQPYDYPSDVTSSISVNPRPSLFTIPASAATDGSVTAIEYERELVTTETTVAPPIENDHLHASPVDNLSKVTVIDRHPHGDGRSFTGFLSGFGLTEGAVATSLTVERTGVVVVGVDDDDMLCALERVHSNDGGWAVVRDGEILTELPTPVGGVCADRAVTDVAADYDDLADGVAEIGIDIDRPLFGVQTLTHPGVPSLRISFSGYADTNGREIIGLSPR